MLYGISYWSAAICTSVVGRRRADTEIVGVMLTVVQTHHDGARAHLRQCALEQYGLPHIGLATVGIEINHVALPEIGNKGVRPVRDSKCKFVIPPALVRAFHAIKRQSAEYVACLHLLLQRHVPQVGDAVSLS